MSIMPLLRSTRGLPLNELHLRTSESWDAMSEELAALIKEGLIEIDGELPENEEQVQRSRLLVSLTRAGTRSMFR